MNFFQGVIHHVKSLFQNKKHIEGENIAMRIGQLQQTHPSYEINQVRDQGRFTRFITATDNQTDYQYFLAF